jgi:hypothetical protein
MEIGSEKLTTFIIDKDKNKKGMFLAIYLP